MLDTCLDTALWVTSQVTSSRLSSISEVGWDFNPGLFVTNVWLLTSGSQAALRFHLAPVRVWPPCECLVSCEAPAATQGNWVNCEGGTEGGGAERAVPGTQVEVKRVNSGLRFLRIRDAFTTLSPSCQEREELWVERWELLFCSGWDIHFDCVKPQMLLLICSLN